MTVYRRENTFPSFYLVMLFLTDLSRKEGGSKDSNSQEQEVNHDAGAEEKTPWV